MNQNKKVSKKFTDRERTYYALQAIACQVLAEAGHDIPIVKEEDRYISAKQAGVKANKKSS